MVSLFSRQKLYVFVSVAPFQVVNIATQFWLKCVVLAQLWWPEFTEAFLFLFYVRNVQVQQNLTARSDFAVTDRRMIFYTGS